MVRSAGTKAQLMAKEGDYAQVRLPSGEVRRFRLKPLLPLVLLVTFSTKTSKLVRWPQPP